MTEEELKEQKTLAYYSALVDGWIQTRMEFDKSLITLSGAGIAGLITLLTTVGFLGKVGCVLYSISVLFFVLTIAILLCVFLRNADHIERIIKGEAQEKSPLRKLDYASRIFFTLAVCATIGIGIVAAKTKGTREMEEESHQQSAPKYDFVGLSLRGAENLAPQAQPQAPGSPPASGTGGGSSSQASLDGVQNLIPSPPPPPPPPTEKK